MLTIASDTASDLFTKSCAAIVERGARVAPRGLPTTEVFGADLVLHQPQNRFTHLPPIRVLNPAFAAAEALWILSGSDADWIYLFNGRLRRFSDQGRLQGAYGPRLRRWRGEIDQLDAVRRVLDQDSSSRQAVIQIFDPARDHAGHRDVPCTLGYRFFIRDGKLSMVTSMRSQDAWLGLPYDLFTATILQELLARWLGVGIGDYHQVVDSLHLYAQNIAPAHALPEATAGPQPAPLYVAWKDFDSVLEQVIAGKAVGDHGWDDFASVIASYRLWKHGDVDNARSLVEGSERPLTTALRHWYGHLENRPSAIPPAPATPTPGQRRSAP